MEKNRRAYVKVIQAIIQNDLPTFQSILETNVFPWSNPFGQSPVGDMVTFWRLAMKMERYEFFKYLLATKKKYEMNEIFSCFSHYPIPYVQWRLTRGFPIEYGRHGFDHPLKPIFLLMTIGVEIFNDHLVNDQIGGKLEYHHLFSLFSVAGYSASYPINPDRTQHCYLSNGEICDFALLYEYPVHTLFDKFMPETRSDDWYPSMNSKHYTGYESLMKMWIQKSNLGTTTVTKRRFVLRYIAYNDDVELLKLYLASFNSIEENVEELLVEFECPKVIDFLWGNK